ncbi:SRPBCC domain-containing protein [Brachybacterium sp. FME24]|uniref:SRPBCC domain-containing protein n=1 Tax=Brachybacterium sp. FME24 TaxID=2742605 RepID=UPI0018675EA9|nr:SRPBCC domain-containing protein [Brachybacterium sp. FME24]
MPITGKFDADRGDLVLTRTVLAPRDRIWEHLSSSDRLETWFGTFSGDPTSGRVMVTMLAEPGEAAPTEYVIHACEKGLLLTVSSGMGEDTWRLSLTLADADADSGDGGAVVSLRHHDLPADMLEHVGPGWEWYLDRLTGAVTGGVIPGMDVWNSEYMSLSAEYAALAR